VGDAALNVGPKLTGPDGVLGPRLDDLPQQLRDPMADREVSCPSQVSALFVRLLAGIDVWLRLAAGCP
jgi:hypothetical protein